MIPNMNSPYKGFATIIVILVVIGALASLAFTNSDLTNFITNSAKAKAIEQANAKQKSLDEIDIQNYDAVASVNKEAEIAKTNAVTQAEIAKTNAANEAEIARINAETARINAEAAAYPSLIAEQQQIEADKADSQQQVYRLASYAIIASAMLLVFCLSIAAVLFSYNRLILAKVQPKQIGIWNDPIRRRNQRMLARQCELTARELNLRQAQTAIVPAFYPEDVPISWEDIRQQFAEARKNRKAN